MSNLSELLPAGAGAKSAEFVASGTLGSGVTVALKSDGTVEAVGITAISQSTTSPASFYTTTYALASLYNPDTQKVIVAYNQGDTNSYGAIQVGTVSASSISFASPVIFKSSNVSFLSMAYDTANQKIVIAYRNANASGNGEAVVGDGVTFGSAVRFEPSWADSSFISAAYDTNAGKIVIASRENDSGSLLGRIVVGTVSGTSISFGTSVAANGGSTAFLSICYDENAQKIFMGSSSPNGIGKVWTVSGTSISAGADTVLSSSTARGLNVAYNPTLQKVVAAFGDASNSNYGSAVVGTISGTSVSFGTKTVFFTGYSDKISCAYDSNAEKMAISFYTNSPATRVVQGTMSGTSISFTTSLLIESVFGSETSSVYDPTAQKVVVFYIDGTNSYNGQYVIYQQAYSATNVADFIGITAEAISDTATGAVNVYGGINEAQTGLTIASDYYVQNDGSISTTSSAVKIGQAISATTINMMDLT